ncbi:MAG: hypothetical protein HQM12_06935 [SAR324 cluster bacterium]|nr:hypothetical protein [SAR324 cluster bacterium]
MSLIDSVEPQAIPCKVPGCKRTWLLDAHKVVESWSNPQFNVPKRMCDECKTQFDKLQTQKVKCSTLDCEEFLEIAPYQQLILIRKHKTIEKEKFFCDSCKVLLKSVGDLEVPCRMKACHNTWKWYASSRLQMGGKALTAQPESRLCDQCFSILKNLTIEKHPCKVKDCNREYTVDRMTQLEVQLTGHKEKKRMCPDCSHLLKNLSTRKMPCKVAECTNTWNWAAFAQLEFQRQQEINPELKEPERYCDHCFGFLKRLKPLHIKCARHGCSHHIDYSVELQFEDHIKHLKPNQRDLLCDSCIKIRESLKDQSFKCKEEGCGKKWVWTAVQQFETGHFEHGNFVTGSHHDRYCDSCRDFVNSHSDCHVACQQCGSPILWTVHQQLKTHLGQWVAPSVCPSCLKPHDS